MSIVSAEPITVEGEFVNQSGISATVFENADNIDSVTGSFLTNKAYSPDRYVYGGAFGNSGTIGYITADFIGNYGLSEGGHGNGGAIDNVGIIGDITGNFENNYISATAWGYGGAISNCGWAADSAIGNIKGNFTGNYVCTTGNNANGGAIDNTKRIESITGNIESNYAYAVNSYAYGGAISNSGFIGGITGDIKNNVAKGGNGNANGGAIDNVGEISFITGGNIWGNYAYAPNSFAYGGAISNKGNIGGITVGYINNNWVKGENGNANGGAIDNEGYIAFINAFIVGNYAYSPSYAYGGAISNTGTIGDIIGESFSSNYAHSLYNNVSGGFIDNGKGGIIGNISAREISNNYVKADMANWEAVATGGAILNNDSTIGDITASFNGNYAQAVKGRAYGGAISNTGGTIGNISGSSFNNNYAISVNAHANGGAIENYNGSIESINAYFTGNYVQSTYSYAYGGALSNNSYITSINGNFKNNYVIAQNDANGGAIDNYQARIDSLTGNFTGNYATGNGVLHGGAINNNGNNASIGVIKGDFTGNYVQGGTPSGGAIYNNGGTIESIEGNFTGNYASNNSTRNNVYGGAIANNGGYIGIIKGDFVNNGAIANGTSGYGGNCSYGGAIYNSENGTIDSIEGNFIGNYTVSPEEGYESSDFGTNYPSKAYTGAIYNTGTINNINGYFEGNYVLDSSTGDSVGDCSAVTNGGVIKNFTGTFNNTYSLGFFGNALFNSGKIENLSIDVTNNKALAGFVMNDGTIQKLSGNFVNNCSFMNIGVLYNFGEIGEIVNSTFVGNYALLPPDYDVFGLGSALLTSTDLNIVADDGVTVFEGNYTFLYDEYTNEDFYNQINKISTYDDIKNFYDSLGIPDGEKDYNAIYVDSASAKLTFNSKNGGAIIMKDSIRGETGYDVEITGDGTGVFYMHNDIYNADVTFNNTMINTINDSAHTYNFNSFTVAGDTNMVVDVDLANEQMDRISAASYGTHNGNINVVGMNLLSDAKKSKVAIYFADSALKNNVTSGVGSVPNGYQTTLYTPIYKYKVTYDKDTIYDETKGDGGYFVFARGSSASSKAYNPAVLTSGVTAQTGAQATQMQTFNYAFQHADMFMNLPQIDRIAMKNRNKYAMSEVSDVGVFSPLLTHDESAGYWFKPYATFENVPLKNGPKVQNISYGTLMGYDSPMESIRNGWDRVVTYYVGYNGSTQYYSGIDAYQNGGLAGATITLYKGHFFNATTISAGASVGESHNMYGTENFTSMLAGVGNKTGYNLEFFGGGFIIQPNLLLSYTFVKTFDYTNAAGVRIDSDPMHSIQIAPGVKFIGNTENGWQPYLAVNMVWDILAHSQVMANNVELPEMSIKPYVQYGIGLQRRFGDRFMAFGQAMVQNGGRNGVALSAGLRVALGKGSDDYATKSGIKEIKKPVLKNVPDEADLSEVKKIQKNLDKKKLEQKNSLKQIKSNKTDKSENLSKKQTIKQKISYKLEPTNLKVGR